MINSIKKIVLITFVSLFFFSCESAKPADTGKGALERLDMSLLQKLDETGKAQYVVTVLQDISKVGDAKVDLSASVGEVLSKSGRVTVRAGGAEIQKGIMKEYELSMSGLTANSVEIGNMLGADVIIFSRVVNLSTNTVDRTVFDEITINVQIEVKAIMSASAKVLFAVTANGKSSPAKRYRTSSGKVVAGTIDFGSMVVEAAQNAAKSVKGPVVKNFPLVGIVLSAGGSVMTDIGANFNVKIGQTISIVRKGAPVKHPTTGKLISYQKTLIASGVVTEVQAETSTIKLKEKNGEPQVGDLAILND